MIELSEETKSRIVLLFGDSEQRVAADILRNACGDNIAGVETAYTDLAERIRFAVLKLSKGNWAVLAQQVQGAGVDFRDVLVAAGFGESLEAHLEWLPAKGNGV